MHEESRRSGGIIDIGCGEGKDLMQRLLYDRITGQYSQVMRDFNRQEQPATQHCITVRCRGW